MSVPESIILQNQVRENSEELQHFLRDLDSWEKDMKKKEDELKLVQVSDEQEFPPIRNSLSRSKKKNRHKKNKETAAPTKERISAYNYKAWENFDVESELKQMDEDKKESSGSESSENDEKFNTLQKQQLAIIKKDKGNEFFKNAQYDSAINCYTIGMELDPENALLPANRAMAFLKKEQFQAAENDCMMCLSLDPTYVKAYLRRGTARKALEKYALAKDDFLKALAIEPDNKQAQLELSQLDKMGLEMDEEFNHINLDITNVQGQHSKPECSITIEELDSSLQDESEIADSHSSADDDKKDESSEKKMNEFVKLEATNHSQADLKETKSVINYHSATKNGTESNDKAQVSAENLCNDIGDVVAALEQTLPPVPTASYQFLTDWKKLSKYPDLKYLYLKQFPPEKFPVLFKHYMEPELFPEILHTLSISFIQNEDDVFHYLKALKSVGRFNTMLLFMSEQEKKDLETLANYLRKSGSPEVEELLKCYDLK